MFQNGASFSRNTILDIDELFRLVLGPGASYQDVSCLLRISGSAALGKVMVFLQVLDILFFQGIALGVREATTTKEAI